MNLRFKTINPGSMLMYKKHNIFKRLWYKIRKKDLPYNCITLFIDRASLLDIYNSKSTEVLFELKKNYNKEELKQLAKLINEYGSKENTFTITFKGEHEIHRLMTILNTIRSFSISLDLNAEHFPYLKNKYNNYYVERLAEEKKWDLCIY